MLVSLSKRFALMAAFAVLLSAFAAPVNAGAPSTAASKITRTTSFITCKPGLVYRCNRYGCFCVRP